jgi:flagellar basal body-associated protein FliL
MRKSIIALVVLAIVIACFVATASAIETCMSVKITQISPDHDGTNVIVVVNQDGDSFMFSDIKWKTRIGQRLYMCITLTYGKGNFWTMNEVGDKEPFLSDKPNKR